ncbi:hypothetical protein GCM10007858_02630 [Bradyrhizobium liaoningense]|nr:hypothetical protein GCM10007858_02630 [Bradyrhizobium liaoningense]
MPSHWAFASHREIDLANKSCPSVRENHTALPAVPVGLLNHRDKA